MQKNSIEYFLVRKKATYTITPLHEFLFKSLQKTHRITHQQSPFSKIGLQFLQKVCSVWSISSALPLHNPKWFHPRVLVYSSESYSFKLLETLRYTIKLLQSSRCVFVNLRDNTPNCSWSGVIENFMFAFITFRGRCKILLCFFSLKGY